MSDSLITSGTIIVAVAGVVWRIAVEVIRKNQQKEVKAIYKENGDTEIVVKGHSPRHEATLIKQLRSERRSRRKS